MFLADEWIARCFDRLFRRAWPQRWEIARQLSWEAEVLGRKWDSLTDLHRGGAHRARRFAEILRKPSLDEALEAAKQIDPYVVYADIYQSSDLITVSTPTLAEQYQQRFGRPIHVLPNCIDLQLPCYQEESRRVPHEGIIVGWTGTRTHLGDLRLVTDPLRVIMKEYDGTKGKPFVRLMLGGDERVFEKLFSWLPGVPEFTEKIADYIEQNGRCRKTGIDTIESDCGRYLFRLSSEDTDSWPLVYSDVDIGIVPLNVGVGINVCKSDVKGLEMAGVGCPCICSPIASYLEWRGKPGTGAIVLPKNGWMEWYTALRELIEDEALRRRMGVEALTWAQTRSIDLWAPRWMEAYEEAGKATGKAWVS